MSNRMLRIFTMVLALAAPALVQSADDNEPDTLFIAHVEVDAGQVAMVEVSFFNDERLAGLTVPLHWSSSDVILDSVSFAGSRIEYLNTKLDTIYNDIQVTVFGGVVFFESSIPVGNGLMASLYFTVPAGTPDQFVEIDTTTYDPASVLFTNKDGSGFVPQVVSGQIKIGDPPVLAHFELSPTSLQFEGLRGFPNPQNQTLSISNSGGDILAWAASVSSGWLSINPSNGTAPSVTAVNVDISSLTEGIYEDTIWLTADNTDNSPKPLPVTLTVTSLPPEIQFSPSDFYVSVIQGGANPDDRYLSISNDVPGSELNWSVTNRSGWLSLDPTSGTPPDSVRLSFDITGLAFGVYSDTIVIFDPEAANSPQIIPVDMQVVSDLPVLEIEPDLLHVIVRKGETAPPKGVKIINSGEGVMTFEVTENSNRIIGVTPSSGTAPEAVMLSFKTQPLSVGDYYDTVTVTSPEAINAPQQFVVHLNVSEDPAKLKVLPGNITMQFYECWQGPLAFPQTKTFQVMNDGSDSMTWWLDYDSDWFSVDIDSGVDYEILNVRLDANGMLLGIYQDTITIYSNDAINGPQKIIVTLNVISGSETPELVSSRYNVTLNAQELFGTTEGLLSIIGVYNNYPGCMDWWIEGDIPWLRFIDSTGHAPASPRVALEMSGITFGEYDDSFSIYSATASNSPIEINVHLNVWRLHGDVNWSNDINVGDVVYMINTIFKFGPGPQPEYLVGDCNCDYFFNVGDVVYLVNYIFKHGDAPCGNP